MTALADETRRLNHDVGQMLWKDSYVAEVPLRLHESGTDAGHGLGGPPLHPKLISYLKSAGVCFCEPEADGKPRPHICDRRFENQPAKFRLSARTSHPHRLKRALRQLRLICVAEFNVVYLMVARGRSWSETYEEVNAGRLTRGEMPYTIEEFTVLMVSGFDKLTAAW